MKQYRAIILGCGRIAGGYDSPGDRDILTHAHAISKSQQIKLAGVYDINEATSKRMASKWKTKAYSSIKKVFEEVNPEIAIVAVPDEFHEDVLDALQDFTPRIIVCEKPLGKDVIRLKHLLQNFDSKKIQIVVNFSRNFDHRIIKLKEQLQLGTFGSFINGVFFYSKGLRHNGSHAISLLRYLFGNICDFRILGCRNDYKAEDPTLDLQLQFENGIRCFLLAGDERAYSIFEWQFLFSKARLTFKQDGFLLCRQVVTNDPLFPGYKTLGDEAYEETGLKHSLVMLYKNIVDNLESCRPLLCTGNDALNTQIEIERIFEHLNHNKVAKT